jgi:hypothetical protein
MRSLIPMLVLLSLALTIFAKVSQSLSLVDKLVVIGLVACLSLSLQTVTDAVQTLNAFMRCRLDSPSQPVFPALTLQCDTATSLSIPLQYERYSLSYKSGLVSYYPVIVSNANLIWALAKPVAKKFVSVASADYQFDLNEPIDRVDELFKRGDFATVNLTDANIYRIVSQSYSGVCSSSTTSSTTLYCDCAASTALQALWQSGEVTSVPVTLTVEYRPFENYKVKTATRSAILHK